MEIVIMGGAIKRKNGREYNLWKMKIDEDKELIFYDAEIYNIGLNSGRIN